MKSNKQSCYSRDAINSRMYIALNSTGIANLDPGSAVVKFLKSKKRRYNLPDPETFKNLKKKKKNLLLNKLSLFNHLFFTIYY